jgi:hypothetical protein
VVLRRCETGTEAAIWADAYRAVLRSLDIAPWWRVKIDPADAKSTYRPRMWKIIAGFQLLV